MAKSKDKSTTDTEIRAALEKSYGNEAVLVHEVPDATGFRNRPRRIDTIAVGCWPSRGLYLHAIEIKVSRSDFLREMKAPEKAEKIARHCDRMFLAAPKGLVQPDELPGPWGLLEVSSAGKVHTTKPAEQRERPAPDHAFYIALVRATVEQRSDKRVLEVIRAEAARESWAKAQTHYEEDRDRLLEDARKTREQLHEFRAVAGRFGRMDPAQVAKLLGAIQSLKGDYGALNHMRSNAREICEQADAIIEAATAIFAVEAKDG